MIVGAGGVGTAIASRLPTSWSVVFVDVNAGLEASLRERYPTIRFVAGDASSRLTLAQCGLDSRSVFIAATPSDLVNREAARIAREHFGVQERVVVSSEVHDAGMDGIAVAECVRPADAVAGRVVNHVSIEASRAVDIGLGVGEILQVTVLEGSPAVGRALKEFGARHWLVAAVYRSGALIVPHGDTRVAAGDRVLLVGDPSDLQDVAPFFRGGAPVFPSQYGAAIAHVGAPAEAGWLAALVGIGDVLEAPVEHQELSANTGAEWPAWLTARSVGCLVVRDLRLPWYVRFGLVRARVHAAVAQSRRPVVVTRGQPGPVSRVLVCLRDARAQRDVLLAGLDLARMTDAEIAVLTVADSPGTVGADVDRIARIYGVDVRHVTVAGNPVVRIRAAAAEADLVVLGIRPEHNNPLAPDVSTFLLHDLPVTAVFVPWSLPA